MKNVLKQIRRVSLLQCFVITNVLNDLFIQKCMFFTDFNKTPHCKMMFQWIFYSFLINSSKCMTYLLKQGFMILIYLTQHDFVVLWSGIQGQVESCTLSDPGKGPLCIKLLSTGPDSSFRSDKALFSRLSNPLFHSFIPF